MPMYTLLQSLPGTYMHIYINEYETDLGNISDFLPKANGYRKKSILLGSG